MFPTAGLGPPGVNVPRVSSAARKVYYATSPLGSSTPNWETHLGTLVLQLVLDQVRD